jgi:hypothetical protein
MKNSFLAASIFFFTSFNLFALELVSPNENISPFSSPEDCLILQYNSGLISKKIMKLYLKIDEALMKNPQNSKIKSDLDAIKKLSDINTSLMTTYETFCKK